MKLCFLKQQTAYDLALSRTIISVKFLLFSVFMYRAYSFQAAADPMMMKEVERMAQLTPDERSQLQSIQDGLQGTKPIDDAWFDSAISTLKTNPGFYKTMLKGKGAMFGGVTDEQTESFVDTAASMDAKTLKYILKFLKYLGSWAKPLTDFYNLIDKYTYGFGKHILLGIFAIIVYQSILLWIYFAKISYAFLYGWYKGTSGTAAVEAVSAAAGSTIPAATSAVSTAAAALAGSSAATAAIISKAAEEIVADVAALAGAGEVPIQVKKEEKEEKRNRWGRKSNKKESKATDGEAVDSEFSF